VGALQLVLLEEFLLEVAALQELLARMQVVPELKTQEEYFSQTHPA
jgi:hypothetical protein